MSKRRKFILDPVFLMVLGIGTGSCLFRLGMADLDIDESFTALITGGNFGQILSSVKTASTPPLYFYLLWGWQTLFGSASVTLRLMSVLIGVFTLTAVYHITRGILNRSAARWSAFLMALSPLWLFRSRDARMYPLVALLALLALVLLYRALLRNRPSDWILFTLVLAVGCYTHNVLVFLLPLALLPFGFPRFKDRRLASILSVCLAIVLWLPWLPVIQKQAGSIALQWIVPYWEALPPILALPKSLLVYLPGTVYPKIMRPMPQEAGFILLVPILLAAAALFYAIRPLSGDRHQAFAKLSPSEIRWMLIAFLTCPLLLMWGYSLVVRPIYLVGRYDIISLPAFCMLAGWGISRWVKPTGQFNRQLRGAVVIVLLGVLWLVTLVSYYQGLEHPRYLRSSLSVSFLKDRLRSGDAMVYQGLRRPKLEYALRRHGLLPDHQVSFPAELDQHPAWFSLSDMMTRMDDLRLEGLSLADALYRYTSPGNRVWVAAAGDNPINRLLLELLSERFQIVKSMSAVSLGIYCFKPVPDSTERN